MEFEGKFNADELEILEKRSCEFKGTEIISKMKSCGTSTTSIENPGTSNTDLKNRGDFEQNSELLKNQIPLEELKNFELPDEPDYEQFPELKDYETWCGIPPEFEEMLKPDELNLDELLFRNHPGPESSDDEDTEEYYQKNLSKQYRKFMRNLISKKEI